MACLIQYTYLGFFGELDHFSFYCNLSICVICIVEFGNGMISCCCCWSCMDGRLSVG